MRQCEPAWASWHCVELCSVLDQVYSSAYGLMLPPNEHGSGAPDFAVVPVGSVCSHDTALLSSTCWPDLGQQMFQLHSVRKSVTIDLKEIPARSHHVFGFRL